MFIAVSFIHVNLSPNSDDPVSVLLSHQGPWNPLVLFTEDGDRVPSPVRGRIYLILPKTVIKKLNSTANPFFRL